MSEFDKPQSRAEAILQNILGANNTLGAPQSRIEVLLMMLLNELHGGSGGAIIVDSDFSTESTNPVENKVITVNFNLMHEQMPSVMSGFDMNTGCGSMSVYNQDLDDVTVSGFYNAMECQNAPFSYMMLIVIGYYVDGFCAQIACDVSTGKYKFRNKINGTWGEWTEDIFEGGGNNGD